MIMLCPISITALQHDTICLRLANNADNQLSEVLVVGVWTRDRLRDREGRAEATPLIGASVA